jgi:hypothetical protein
VCVKFFFQLAKAVAECKGAEAFVWHSHHESNPTTRKLQANRCLLQVTLLLPFRSQPRLRLPITRSLWPLPFPLPFRTSCQEGATYCTDLMMLLALNTVNTNEKLGRCSAGSNQPNPSQPTDCRPRCPPPL